MGGNVFIKRKVREVLKKYRYRYCMYGARLSFNFASVRKIYQRKLVGLGQFSYIQTSFGFFCIGRERKQYAIMQ